MKNVGKQDLACDECGFAPIQDGPTCGKRVIVHAIFLGTWEDLSFGTACEGHAEVLKRVADLWHNVDPETCLDLGARWLTRTDGSSFCYHPETEAEWQRMLADPSIAYGAIQ